MGFQECLNKIKEVLEPTYTVHFMPMSTNPRYDKDVVLLLDDMALSEEGPTFMIYTYLSITFQSQTITKANDTATDIINKLLKGNITCNYTFADIRVVLIGKVYAVSIILEIREEVS